MLDIPETVLENLRCSICNGYLSCSPVVVNHKNQQVCAKCYKILPQSEKNQCLRQISYECVASNLIFPCRYYKMGCDRTFCWNEQENHEVECSKRYFTYPDVVSVNKFQTNADVHNELKENNNNADMIVTQNYYNIRDTKMVRNDVTYGSTTTFLTSLSDDTISKPLIPPESTSRKTLPIYENFYETLPTSNKRMHDKCNNCQVILKDKTSNCLFGHVTCESCKGEMCLICFKDHEGTSRKCCKNVKRGCTVKLLEGDVAYHRDNCEFNVLPCPIEVCDKKDILDNLKYHLRQHHSDSVHEKNELSVVLNKQDKVFVFLVYDTVFKCAYYYYSAYIEIFVTYLGPCEKARDYFFEVSVVTNSKVNKKRREVANWNNNMLAAGVNFEKKELMNSGEKKFSFEINIKLLRIR